MGSKREKYPEKCPWDLGPNQHLAKQENWTLRLGEANVSFSKNKLDNNYFHVISNENEEQMDESTKATFGGGCFWCHEAVFQQVTGVIKVVSGYAGGASPNPSYEAVCSGLTGHAEVVQIEYDLGQTDFRTLLDWFWRCHDPTTLNRQGADVGTQYRSVIFCHDEEQLEHARTAKQDLESSGMFRDPVVTEISMIPEFYPAEDYHQNYYQENSGAGYCQFVIRPKMQKLGFE